MSGLLDQLSDSCEPSIRYKARVLLAPQLPPADEILILREAVRTSERVRLLLSERTPEKTIPLSPYNKWRGAHWVLMLLAELGYPFGDDSLIPMREQVLGCWLAEEHYKSVRYLEGRARRCASQEGNACYALLSLGLADTRVDTLIERLIKWQWPDGGWNCDKRPEAHNSSFHESLIPLRALALYARLTGNVPARQAAEQAADVFLKRQLYKRQSDSAVIRDAFIRLYYPSYWHYDVLFGLKVLAEAGFIHDPRCNEALDLLESKRTPDGGFPAEGRHYSTAPSRGSGRSLVEWGPVSKRTMNPFVTVDALWVLKQAGRWL
ncbi:MAG: prenyltransferase/squalene oxidase repeat-containing protein [Anaerolineae bacterium]